MFNQDWNIVQIEAIEDLISISGAVDVDCIEFTNLDLSDEKLEEITSGLASLPPNIKHLMFKSVAFGSHDIDDICNIFSSIPTTVEVVSFIDTLTLIVEKEGVEERVRQENFLKLLGSIPNTVKRVDLGELYIINCSDEYLSQILTSIRFPLISLDIGLGDMIRYEDSDEDNITEENVEEIEFKDDPSDSEMEVPDERGVIQNTQYLLPEDREKTIRAFSDFSPTTIALNLAENLLERAHLKDLLALISGFPVTIRYLNLSFNNLGLIKTSSLDVHSLPSIHIEELDLSSNDLGLTNPDQLKIILKSLCNGVKKVSLANNQLGEKDKVKTHSQVINLSEVLSALSPSLESLDLSANDLFCKPLSLINCMKKLPRVRELDVSDNCLGGVPGLPGILKSIPSSVTVLKFSGNNIFTDHAWRNKERNLSERINEILASFPMQLEVLDLSNNGLNTLTVIELRALVFQPIDTLILGYEEISSMDRYQIQALRDSLQNVDKVKLKKLDGTFTELDFALKQKDNIEDSQSSSRFFPSPRKRGASVDSPKTPRNRRSKVDPESIKTPPGIRKNSISD